MSTPAAARSSEALADRPGWAALREAADELHAAALLIGDPIASPATAVPHLREFWRAATAAAVAAKLAPPEVDGPAAWFACESPLLDERARARMRQAQATLAGEQAPNKRELRAMLTDAQALLARLEPDIGGVPLRRRRQRIAWAVVGVALLLTPIAVYTAVHAEVPGTGPWRAAYYADKEFDDDPVLVREDSVEHDWDDTAPHEKIAPDKYSVRWDTCLRVDEAGPVVFQVNANDGARVLIDGEAVIDAWDKDPVTRRRGFGSAEVQLDAGVHHLRVEFYESLGDAHIKFSASLDGSLPGPLPRERLSYPGDEFDEQDPCAAVR